MARLVSVLGSMENVSVAAELIHCDLVVAGGVVEVNHARPSARGKTIRCLIFHRNPIYQHPVKRRVPHSGQND